MKQKTMVAMFVDKANYSIKDMIEKFYADQNQKCDDIFRKDEPILFNHDFTNQGARVAEGIEDGVEDYNNPTEKDLNKDYQYIISEDDLNEFYTNNFNEDNDIPLQEVLAEYINQNYGIELESFTYEFDVNKNLYIIYVY